MKKTKFLVKLGAISIAAVMSLSVASDGYASDDIGAGADGGISVQNIAITKTYNNLQLGFWGKLTCQGSTQVQRGYYAEVIVELQ